MNKQNYNDLEKDVETKAGKRDKKKSKKMKVSGAGVKGLQSLIMQNSKCKNKNEKSE